MPAESRSSLSPSRRRLFALLTFLLFAGVVIGADAAAGAYFRRHHPGSTLATQANGRFIAAPYRDFANNPTYIRRYDGLTYRYNSDGFREEVDLQPKAPNEFRVFVIGGSTAYGERSSELGQYQLISGQRTYPSDQTISAHLQRELAVALPGRTVRVINAAVVNYRLVNCYMTYLAKLRGLAPDLIVSIDGQNENFGRANPFFAGEFRDIQNHPVVHALRAHSYILYHLSLGIRSTSLFNRLAGRKIVELDDREMSAIDLGAARQAFANDRAGAVVDRANLDSLMLVYEQFFQAAKTDGVPVLFISQPIITLDTTKVMTATEEKLLKYTFFRKYFKGYVMRLAERLHERAARDDGFTYADLMNPFTDFAGEAYTDYCHLTPAANHHFAKRLSSIILGSPGLIARAR